MAKNDYIEKITQNLKHLTKDELKDVSILTTAQFGVRLKVAEKEYIEKEIADLKSQLQQQTLPVVPEFVAEWYEKYKGDLEHGIFLINVSLNETAIGELTDVERWFNDVSNEPNETIFIMKHLGYTVEKPQLFYLGLPNVYGLNKITSDSIFVSKAESGVIFEFTKEKVYDLKLTEQEIKSIDERYWQFAVPVEDGE
ncbi:DUF1642 domain-containing protein [Lactococcus lactis]|uniref:DUF1642 domain-containing protein n=1 Tax=Lactococcus lactis TaxID=1358 RepID=UPI0013C56099|nr:DUF1642 domain-containing protein [Lactococcus lactis]NEX59319.1 DUF1642 domain-containing protein [Lactococcus lactis]